jgi:glycosyl transferase family 2
MVKVAKGRVLPCYSSGMSLGFKLFWVVTAAELILWLLPSIKVRRTLAVPLMLLLAVASLTILISQPDLITILLGALSVYRIINLVRLVRGRIQYRYLRHLTIQSSLWIIALQVGLWLIWQIAQHTHLTPYQLWLGFAYLDLVGSLYILLTTIRQLNKTKPPQLPEAGVADRDLPTLTVAIPARNETDDLEACLKSVVASNYPKLEVVVLDDCSQNKRTPEIIRQFAQDGVVFIQGAIPKDNWLAKNQAYQRLFDESNGELLLFCGVDVRFAPDSMRHLVLSMIVKHKRMISVIPKNVIDHTADRRGSALIQPLRYAWEIVFPRKLFRRPAVLSTCWIIQREALAQAGGFNAVSNAINPESYFARTCASKDGYSFMQSDRSTSISSHKSFAEQKATFIRTRYPQLHRRIELVMILTILELLAVITPFVLLILGIFGQVALQLSVVSLLILIVLTIVTVRVVSLTYRRWLPISLVLLPLLILLDVALQNYSMFRYEFSSVDWKGRNVCIPIMHITDQLPPLSS